MLNSEGGYSGLKNFFTECRQLENVHTNQGCRVNVDGERRQVLKSNSTWNSDILSLMKAFVREANIYHVKYEESQDQGAKGDRFRACFKIRSFSSWARTGKAWANSVGDNDNRVNWVGPLIVSNCTQSTEFTIYDPWHRIHSKCPLITIPHLPLAHFTRQEGSINCQYY